MPTIDDNERENYETAKRLISEQNLAVAAVAGAVAAILSALAYGLVVGRWPVTYGFAAATIGIVVGFFVGFLGRGISAGFSVLAAMYTVAGCLLGNLFAHIWTAAQGPTMSLSAVLRSNPPSTLAHWAVSGLSAIHLVFWLVAIAAAAFLARRPLSRSDRLALGLYEERV